jgi:alkanesulfonate monooxygenase SsuD/methylene tetrahydromethanopterin reductase-like flavin-dependent oxidoreductase (luciferase family)
MNEFKSKIFLGINIDPNVTELNEAFKVTEIADNNNVDLIGIQDHPYIGFFFDTLTLISYLSAKTKRIKFIPNVANLPLRLPTVLAKSIATLDILTKGRIELGLGAGANLKAVENYGGPKRNLREAIEALEEAIIVIRLIWGLNVKTKTVSFIGKYYRLQNAYPGPFPHHKIGIWLGANGKRMLELTGKLAEGWTISMFYVSPEEIKEKIKILEKACLNNGRKLNDIIRNYNLAGEITKENQGPYIDSDNLIHASTEEWIELIIKFYKDLNMNSFIFWPTSKEKFEQIKLFCEKICPIIKEQIQ